MSFIQKLFTSRDNNANSATYVGEQDRLWWDPVTNQFYYSDGNTAGGFPVGGGSGNAVPAGSNTQIQFNNNNSFGASPSLTFDNSSNVLTLGGSITATGNVTANYFVGNGSQLTGINVNTNKIFNGNSYANIAVADGNVEINANGQSWNFDTAGNLTLPGNSVSINYANGTPYGGTGNITAGNVTIQNQGSTLTTAVNTINFTGNGVVASNVGNIVTVNVSGGGGSLPPQTGNAGKILSTDGVNPLWETMPGVFGLVIDGGDAAFASLDFIIDGGPA